MLWAFQHGCRVFVLFFSRCQFTFLGQHSTATHDESEIPGGFVSGPVLVAVPADTQYVKYGHVSLQNQALNGRKNTSTPIDSQRLQTCG